MCLKLALLAQQGVIVNCDPRAITVLADGTQGTSFMLRSRPLLPFRPW
jgi:hypothetical protein